MGFIANLPGDCPLCGEDAQGEIVVMHEGSRLHEECAVAHSYVEEWYDDDDAPEWNEIY